LISTAATWILVLVLALAGCCMAAIGSSPATGGLEPRAYATASGSGNTSNGTAGVTSVSIYSSYPGQNQYLAVPPNASGIVVYPHWLATLISTSNVSYAVYVSGLEVASGFVFGEKAVAWNVVGDVVNVSVGLGSVVYHYDHEFLSNVPLRSYYSSPPPPPIATALQVTFDELAIAVAFGLSIAGAMFTARKTVVERKKREIQVVG
jgi:hypothetical protein